MKVSRKIVITTFAYAGTTIAGFLGTIYLANVLGPGPLGTFALGMTLVKWLELTDFGAGGAMVKRISEREDEGEFFSASLIAIGLLVLVPTVSIVVFRSYVNQYVGGNFAVYIALMFLLTSSFSFVGRGLLGLNKAHIKTSTDTVERILRVVFQAGLVFVGYHVFALYWGYLASVLLATSLGIVILIYSDIRPKIPKPKHFRSLYNYAKFNLLTRLRNRTFSWIDVFILGFFVTNEAVGIYQVTWNVAMTFWLVSNAIGSNLFPEISNLSAEGKSGEIQRLLNEGLAYAGLIAIPGLIGSILVGRGVLHLYGSEFVSATDLLIAVSVLALIKAYEAQVLSALNSLDHPEYSFRVNIAFVISNIGLNLLLIPEYGLIGAAVATAISITVSLIYSWYFLQTLVPVSFPKTSILEQTAAAIGMGCCVYLLKQVLSIEEVLSLVMVVLMGCVVYFGLLLTISKKFRTLAFDILGDLS